MSIPISRYVDITSGVGAGASVQARELIGRLFTTNVLVPTRSLLEFTDPADVGVYFGTASEEYKRAAFYFGWISKNITKPRKISFARWTDADAAPMVLGVSKQQSIAGWQAVVNGAFQLTLGADTHNLIGLTFAAVVSLSDVAAVIQTAVRAANVAPVWANATVTWDAGAQRFTLVGGEVGTATVGVMSAAPNVDIADRLGWAAGAILSNGAEAETVTDTLDLTIDASTNFGSFAFIPALTEAQQVEAAVWTNGQNVRYQYHLAVLEVDEVATSDALAPYAGVGITLQSPVAGEYPEMLPMMILAATDYGKRAAVQNFMFQMDDRLTPSVSNSPRASALDARRINYYGRTQTAGQIIQFYQRGVLQGPASAPLDMNTFANEQWLKDAATVSIMELLLALSRLSANAAGRSSLLATLQPVIEQGLFNGTISVGKPLTQVQKQYIGQQTGDPRAWFAVQNAGYWVDGVIQRDGDEFKIVYTLIYSKDDAIRKVEGSHQLI